MSVERLTDFAASQQQRFDASTSVGARKERGHFGTPPAIARFMAAMFSTLPTGTIRLLDAGAGVGSLSAAVVERILTLKSKRTIYCELWENDPAVIPFLEETVARCRTALEKAGHKFECVIRIEDFILATRRTSLFATPATEAFDLAILNPPYFKLRKGSPHAQAMQHVIHGQPNIYALFMAAAAELLQPGGELVAITPRSYFNGPYFKRFRKWFFDRMSARQIHIFQSRTEAFKADAVLQENVILLAEKSTSTDVVTITTSGGRDLASVEREAVLYRNVIANADGDHIVRVTLNQLEQEIVAALDGLPHRFQSQGFQISTGPVVTFRSTKFLRHERGRDTAPLMWMHNVRPFITQFPEKNRKPTHIEVSDASKYLLLPTKTYVLLKRFTAKEEKRRLVAGILKPKDSYSEWIGLENHLNYVYRRGATLSTTEAVGLAAFFNSAIVDRYFRAISGNTQVNAAEIRVMPVPDEVTLELIADQVQGLSEITSAQIEQIVGHALRLPKRLINQLVEVAT